jgi:hypothetical protein
VAGGTVWVGPPIHKQEAGPASVGTLLCDMNVEVKGDTIDRVSSTGKTYRFQSDLSCKTCGTEVKGWHCVDVAADSGPPPRSSSSSSLEGQDTDSSEGQTLTALSVNSSPSNSGHNSPRRSPRGASLSPRSVKGASNSPRTSTASEVFFCVSADNNVRLDVPPQAEAVRDVFRDIAFAFRP